MEFQDAMSRLTAEFGPGDKCEPTLVQEICSGGSRLEITDKTDPNAGEGILPALYATKELATAAWYQSVVEFMRSKKATAWMVVEGPACDSWHLTVTDAKITHRVVENRYSVVGKIGIVEAKAKPAVEAKPEKAKGKKNAPVAPAGKDADKRVAPKKAGKKPARDAGAPKRGKS